MPRSPIKTAKSLARLLNYMGIVATHAPAKDEQDDEKVILSPDLEIVVCSSQVEIFGKHDFALCPKDSGEAFITTNSEIDLLDYLRHALKITYLSTQN